MIRNFLREEDGMGTVEMVLIIVVLISLVAAFKSGMNGVVSSIIKKIKDNANKI